jgi:PAS domain-containing protein
LDGEPITFPDGPNTNMGEFYDMFERREYKRGYFELNRQLREQKIPVYVELSEFTSKKMQAKPINVGQTRETRKMTEFANISAEKQEGATAGVVVGIPLLIDDKHTATWINCAFTQEEVRRVDAYLPALWVICRYMAQFVYSNTIAEKQAQKTRLSEIQARELLERSATIRDILRRCNETNEENVLAYVLQKVGEFLKLSRISLFRYTDTMSMPTCWYEWDSKGMKQNVDVHSGIYTPEYFNQQRDAFERNGRTVYDGDKIPIRLRRVLSESLIRAIVAMPIYTLTEEKQYIIFVESNYERVWTEDELSFMNSAVSILQGFLQRMRSNVNVHDVTETKMQFLDLSRDYIYIKNEDTEEIVYVNPRLEELIGKDAVGKKCYEVFRHQSIRCMDCYQKKDECRELVNSWMYRKVFNRAMRVREQQTSWNGNGHMKMVLLSPEDK